MEKQKVPDLSKKNKNMAPQVDHVETAAMTAKTQTQQNHVPLKIVLAADTYLPLMNGSARFSNRLATGMAARGHEVHLFAASTASGGYHVEHDPAGFSVHRLTSHSVPTHNSFRLSLPFQIKKDIARVFDEVTPDVVHVQCHYMIGKAVLEEGKKRGIRVIATNHFMPENLDPFLPFPQWFKQIVAKQSWKDMGKVMRKADHVTTPTQLAAQAMSEHAYIPNVLALSNGIDAAAYEPRAGEIIVHPPYPLVLFVGRLAVEKHIDDLIKALAKTPEKLNIHIDIIGEGEQENSLKELAQELGLQERANFLGGISDEELRQAYLRANLFVMPSTAELQSLATLEAMSASTPVILADAMALPHLVSNGDNGYLFEPRNIEDLAQKITTLLSATEEERDIMGSKSRTMVAKHNVNDTLTAFETLYYGNKIKNDSSEQVKNMER